MKQTEKGNTWYYGMKVYTGVDTVTGLTHSVATTSANVADVTMAGDLVRDKDERVYGDAGYTGMWRYLGEGRVARSPGAVSLPRSAPSRSWIKAHENASPGIREDKVSIRAKVEHP